VLHSPSTERVLDANFYLGAGGNALEQIASGQFLRTADAPGDLRGRFICRITKTSLRGWVWPTACSAMERQSFVPGLEFSMTGGLNFTIYLITPTCVSTAQQP
jgi:hypothetical protein